MTRIALLDDYQNAAHRFAPFGRLPADCTVDVFDEPLELGVELVNRETLFADSDVLTIHLVIGQRNRALVGADELASMKPDALLINTSRGPIVDESALIAALEAGLIGGAGLDVYEQEPLPTDHPLRSAPRTLLTSHVGFVTEQTYRIYYGETLEAIEAWLAGAPAGVLEP